MLINADKKTNGATLFAYMINDPERYGVVELNQKGKLLA